MLLMFWQKLQNMWITLIIQTQFGIFPLKSYFHINYDKSLTDYNDFEHSSAEYFNIKLLS